MQLAALVGMRGSTAVKALDTILKFPGSSPQQVTAFYQFVLSLRTQ
jgi:hypothetical protein